MVLKKLPPCCHFRTLTILCVDLTKAKAKSTESYSSFRCSLHLNYSYPNRSMDMVGDEGGVCIEPAMFVRVPFPEVAQWWAAAAADALLWCSPAAPFNLSGGVSIPGPPSENVCILNYWPPRFVRDFYFLNTYIGLDSRIWPRQRSANLES